MPLIRFILLFVVLSCITVVLGYYVSRSNFSVLLGLYWLFFIIYWLVCKKELAPKRWLIPGILLRFLLLFSIPNWSDDIFRYLWDGYLLAAGIDPFRHLPSYYFETNFFPLAPMKDLYGLLNSPGYFSVYPPVSQGFFGISAWFSPDSFKNGILIFKIILLIFEVGTIWLLKTHEKTGKSALWYALNPLAIFEISGNGHLEGVVIFFILASLHLLKKKQISGSAILFGLSIATKLVPAYLTPVIFRWLGLKKGILFAGILAISLALIFLPFLESYNRIAQSVGLFFSHFSSNASIFNLFRELTGYFSWWEIQSFAGLFLGGLTLLFILIATWKAHSERPIADLIKIMLFISIIFLINSAVVHPWYILLPLGISLLTPYRFVVVWSGLAALSYSQYMTEPWQEHWPLIAIEYAGWMGFFFWETRLGSKDIKPGQSPKPLI